MGILRHASEGRAAAPRSGELSWRERRARERVARAEAKAAERAAREQARLAEREAKERAKREQQLAKEAERRARAEAKAAERAAREQQRQREREAKERAKREAQLAKEAERRAREEAKRAERRAREEAREEERERREAERRAAARAKEAERAAREAERRARAEAKAAERAAREQQRQREREAKERAKREAQLAKEAERRAREDAKAQEKAAREQARLAAKEAKERAKAAAKAAKAERRAQAKAERQRRRGQARAERRLRFWRSGGKGVKTLVGLEIGASQVAAARVANNGAPELVRVAREPLEPGLVVSGEVRDPEGVAAALRRLFEAHKLPCKGIRLGISNNRVGVRVFEIEGIRDAEQLENAVRFRAEDVLPIPLEQAVLDYVVLAEEERTDGTKAVRVLLVVAYRDVVDRYLAACQGAGLEVVGVDLEAFALLRALSAPTDAFPGGGALIGVVVGHDRTTIAVSTGRTCDFTRVLDWGGWSLNVAIARTLDKAPSEVEAVKRQLSLVEDRPIEGLSPEQVARAREAARAALATFARELVASLQFYQAQPGALAIAEIQVTGGATHLPGFPEELSRLIGVPVQVGDPLRRMLVASDVGRIEPLGSFAVAIGLGIED